MSFADGYCSKTKESYATTYLVECLEYAAAQFLEIADSIDENTLYQVWHNDVKRAITVGLHFSIKDNVATVYNSDSTTEFGVFDVDFEEIDNYVSASGFQLTNVDLSPANRNYTFYIVGNNINRRVFDIFLSTIGVSGTNCHLVSNYTREYCDIVIHVPIEM